MAPYCCIERCLPEPHSSLARLGPPPVSDLLGKAVPTGRKGLGCCTPLTDSMPAALNFPIMSQSNQSHVKFPGLAELARFVAQLSSGFLADTNRVTVSGHLTERDIQLAEHRFQGKLLHTL
jgi:hypothetical protein